MNLKETNLSHHDSKPEQITSMVYKHCREHLTQELLKLDSLIRLQVLRVRYSHSVNEFDEFSGLSFSEEEVDKLLGKDFRNKDGSIDSTSESKINALLNHIGILQKRISKRVEESVKLGFYLPIQKLSTLFNLTPFEMDTILICLAPELNLKYEKLYAYLQNDVTKKYPSVNLILDLLCSTQEQRIKARSYFSTQAPLLNYHLIKFADDSKQKSLLSKHLKLDDRIVDFLLGFSFMDFKLDSLVKIINPERDWSALVMDGGLKEILSRFSKECFKNRLRYRPIFYFCGPCGAGKKLAAEAFCQDLKLPLITVDTKALLSAEIGFGKAVNLLFREALLQPAAVYIEHFDLLITDDPKDKQYQNILFQTIEELSWVTFLAGEKLWYPHPGLKKNAFLNIEFPVPSYPLRKLLWKLSLDNGHPMSPEVDIDGLANKFRFTGGQIQDALVHARNLAMMQSRDGDGRITLQDLYKSCRIQSNQKLSEMTQKIKPHYSWPDIVLPSDKLQQLREISNYVKYRQTVYYEWGFDRKLSLGKGLNIFFSGPSGTGKTMAAEIISNELQLDLYKIDLSCVVSKYIGETEKNLSKIFNEAETSNAILFFDEADALFGKRSEVRDSHDRYANIEINYLLQKMEEHEGIVILATNFRKNVDEAFNRRVHFSVDFPFPDEKYRIRIWQNIFPKKTPQSENIDYEFLAKKFSLSGGNIKNVALNAAFLAAEKSEKIGMEQIIWATKREFQKMGKPCVQSDFGKYYDLLMSERGQR